MATLSDLEEVKAALDKGLVSQAEFDEVKRDYLRAKKEALEYQKKELRAKEEALEFQKKELRAKEEALEANKEFLKRELIAKEAFQQRKSEAELRTYALDSIVKHGSNIMSEEQKVDLVRDYAKMSGLDRGAEKDERASKRQRPLPEERDAAPPQPQPLTPPASAAVPPPADAPIPADEDKYSNYIGGDDGEDDSDYDEPRTEKQHQKRWTEEDEAALVAALRAGQRITKIRIGGRAGGASYRHLQRARENGWGSPALREYLEETRPEYVYKGPPKNLSWSAEEDQTFIQAHKEGKTPQEIAALLPGRRHTAVTGRWRDAKIGKAGSAALLAYAAESRKG